MKEQKHVPFRLIASWRSSKNEHRQLAIKILKRIYSDCEKCL